MCLLSHELCECKRHCDKDGEVRGRVVQEKIYLEVGEGEMVVAGVLGGTFVAGQN